MTTMKAKLKTPTTARASDIMNCGRKGKKYNCDCKSFDSVYCVNTRLKELSAFINNTLMHYAPSPYMNM